MKAALMSTAIPWQPPPHLKPLKSAAAPLCCSKVNGASSSPIKLQGGEDAEAPPSPIQPEADIWRLFREAQKNILHLNQHRLKAVEDLNKTNSEKQLLLDRIEQLELEKQQTSVAKPRDRLSSCWEVLLRIDSMVLTGMIGAAEASDLRRMVMDHKTSLAEVFNGTMQKTDGQLLTELRHFYARSRRKRRRRRRRRRRRCCQIHISYDQEWLSHCAHMHGNDTIGLCWIAGVICDRLVSCTTEEGAFGGGDTSKVFKLGPR